MNCPSRKFSALPESLTNGTMSIAGSGGKLMYVLPWKSTKSLFIA